MEQSNWYILFISALIPLLVGYIWFHPKVLGTRFATNSGNTLSEIGPPKNIGKLALIYLFSLLLSYLMVVVSTHQVAIYQLFMMEPDFLEPGSEFSTFATEFMNKYGARHRSFGHGMIHGAEAGLFFGFSLIGTSALMAGKPLKSIWMTVFFWVVCCSLMAGVNCAFL